MVKENNNFFCENPFLPQPLKKEKIYGTNLVSIKKRETDLDFSFFYISNESSSSDLLKMPENRYWIYKKAPFSFLNQYSLRLQFFDQTTRSFVFTTQKKKCVFSQSTKKNYFFRKERTSGKGRLLSISRKANKISFHGNILQNSNKILKNKKKKKLIFKKAKHILFGLSSYGYLKHLNILSARFEKRKIYKKKKKNSFLKRKQSFYFNYLLSSKNLKERLFNFFTLESAPFNFLGFVKANPFQNGLSNSNNYMMPKPLGSEFLKFDLPKRSKSKKSMKVRVRSKYLNVDLTSKAFHQIKNNKR